MPETSGNWTGANHLASAVYRGAAIPPAANEAVQMDSTVNVNSATITYPPLIPVTYPASLGTGWYVAFGSSSAASDVKAYPPTGMALLATAPRFGGEGAVFDTGGTVSTNYPGESFVLNASSTWATTFAQVPAATTVSRIGADITSDNDTVPIPAGHRVGDLILIWAVKYGPAQAAMPADYTQLQARSSILVSERLAYKIAVSESFLPWIAVY